MIFKYKVNWYFEEGEKECVDVGLLVARNFTNAMENILQAFDDSELLSVNLEWVDEDDLIHLSTITEAFKTHTENNELDSGVAEVLAVVTAATEALQ